MIKKKKSEIKMKKFQCMQSYYETQRNSYLKRPHVLSIFYFTEMNIQIITNHLRLSFLISFICTNTNNYIIVNHPRFSITEKSSKNPASCYSALSTVSYYYTYKINPYAHVHKSLTKNPAIWISLNFMHVPILIPL